MEKGDKIRILQCPELVFEVKDITEEEYVLATKDFGMNIKIKSMPDYEEVKDGETD